MWKLSFIYREGNQVDHHLAKFGLHYKEELILTEVVPSFVMEYVRTNKTCISEYSIKVFILVLKNDSYNCKCIIVV